MSLSHKSSQLALKGVSIPIEPGSTLFHFDHHAYDHTGTIRPLGVYPDIEDGLVGYWDFSQEQEIAYDLSGNDNHGTIVGATWGNGRNGKALSFDGVNDYIQSEDSPNFNLGEENTFCFWIKPTVGTTQTLACKRTNFDNGFFIYFNASGYIIFDYGGSDYRWTTTCKLSNNQWTNVVFTRTSTLRKIFINGEEVASTTDAGNNSLVNTDSPLRIGQSTFSGEYYFNGLMDKVAIYNRALSPEEIQAHYNEGIYTIREDGRYGGSIAVEKATTNLCVGLGGGNYSMDAIYVQDRSKCEFVSIRGKTWVKRNAADTSFRLSSIQVKPNTTYTWSMTVYSDTDTTLQFTHYDGSGYSSQAGVTVGTTPRRIVKTFTTRASSSYEILHIYVVGNISHYFSDFQLEEMPFATSFVDGAREDGKLIYPTNVSGDFTCSLWCKFNYEWYNNFSGYNKKMIRFNSSIDGGHITWTDWSSSLGSSLPFLDLEPNTYWDGVQHHWHDAFQYSADKWYYITFIKSGNSMRQIVYDDLAEKCNDRVFTYTDSSKFANFSFDQIVFFGEWCSLIDELRIDDIARTDEEIYAWYISSAPHFPPDRIKAIG